MTEYDVLQALKDLKYDVNVFGLDNNLNELKEKIEEFKPHIVFNLMEGFDGLSILDHNVVSFLELLKIPYTGCSPRGLMIARDKALAKKIMTYHRLPTPKFFVFPKNKKMKRPKNLTFPLIVKCLREESSTGISQASIVHNDEKLQERIEFINRSLADDALVEEFIPGKEYYVGLYGNYQIKALPVWELKFEKSTEPSKEIYSARAKYNMKYRKEKGITSEKAQLPSELTNKIQQICKRTYKALHLNGYARLDLRVTDDGKVYILEANPNPNLESDDEFALSAQNLKLSYKKLIKKILTLGFTWSSYEH
ncbi:MAG: ATP-grasp domain-containing protein [Bacteriovoracaceae bacterium]|nr:ATP-grasp domain-containing protein [Bacteriovoracaceae bacterium]